MRFGPLGFGDLTWRNSWCHSRQWWHGRFTRAAGAGISGVGCPGNGGQRLITVPALDLVVEVTAGRHNQPNNGRASGEIFRAVPAQLWA